MRLVQWMVLMIWDAFQQIFLNLFTQIVSYTYMICIKTLSHKYNTFVASDNNTVIYTAATCGTDHNIRIWRIFALLDFDEDSETRSRLVPTTPQVSMTIITIINVEYFFVYQTILLHIGTPGWKCNNILYRNNEHRMCDVYSSPW